MINILSKINNFFINFIIVFLGILTLAYLILSAQLMINKNRIPSLFGYTPIIVVSGSMYPTITPGDMIVIKSTNLKSIFKNDIITFKDNKNILTTHRVDKISVNNNAIIFNTKGDKNNSVDSEVVYEKDLVGKYIFKIPRVGIFLNFIKSSWGYFIFIVSPSLMLILICIKNILNTLHNHNYSG